MQRRQMGRKNRKRPIYLLLSILLVIGIILAVIFIIMPELSDSVSSLVSMVPSYVSEVESWWEALALRLDKYGVELPQFSFDTDKFIQILKDGGTAVLTPPCRNDVDRNGGHKHRAGACVFHLCSCSEGNAQAAVEKGACKAHEAREDAEASRYARPYKPHVYKLHNRPAHQAVIIGLCALSACRYSAYTYAPAISV